MSAMSEPGRQLSLSDAISRCPTAEPEPEPEPEPDCGHDAIWMESGACMVCEPAWSTPDDKEAYLDQMPDVYGRNPL